MLGMGYSQASAAVLHSLIIFQILVYAYYSSSGYEAPLIRGSLIGQIFQSLVRAIARQDDV